MILEMHWTAFVCLMLCAAVCGALSAVGVTLWLHRKTKRQDKAKKTGTVRRVKRHSPSSAWARMARDEQTYNGR